jgi:hypothetical protein
VKRGKFKKPVMATMLGGLPQSVRFSTAMTALRRAGSDNAVAELERDRRECGSSCPQHGELKDPAIAILNGRVAFICPWCSGGELLAAWEKEGMRS